MSPWKKNNPGCPCCGGPSSPCTDCCPGGTALQIKATMPENLFSPGEFCDTGYCPDVGGEVFLDHTSLLHDCDWVYVEDEPACGGPTLAQYGARIRKNIPTSGQCTATFTYALTCSGFATIYTWEGVQDDGDPCGAWSLPYAGASGDGVCCDIIPSPGPVVLDFNP